MSFKKQPKKSPHVYIATPAYDGKVQVDFAMSIAETCQLATVMGIRVTVCIMRNNIFIDHARNHFARLFLETDCTHLFFIDSDLRFEPRAVVSLVNSDFDICAGAYPKRQDPEEYPVKFANKDDGIWVENGWVLCTHVPTGFLCIKRKVVEEMWEAAEEYRCAHEEPVRRMFYTFINEEKSLVGEDFAFCLDYGNRYKKAIPVWPDFDFTHGERWEGNFHKYLNRMSEEERAEEAQTSAAA